MKNIKRFFTIIMALAMVLSCTAVASAAEVKVESETSTEEMHYTIVHIVDGVITVETTDELPASTFANRTMVNIDEPMTSGRGNGKSGSFQFPWSSGDMSVAFACSGSGTFQVRITKANVSGDLFYGSTTGQAKGSTIYNMSYNETVRWECWAEGGNLDWAILTIAALS